MPRKATWLIILWTGLFLYLAFSPTMVTTACPAGDPTCAAAAAVAVGIAISMLFGVWFVGFIILAIIWFMTRPSHNVEVFGPSGQRVMLSESDARRRVERDGWTYTSGG